MGTKGTFGFGSLFLRPAPPKGRGIIFEHRFWIIFEHRCPESFSITEWVIFEHMGGLSCGTRRVGGGGVG